MATVTFTDESVVLGTGTIPTAWLPVSSAWPSVAGCETEIYKHGQYFAFDPLYEEGIIPLTGSQQPCLPPELTSSYHQSNAGVTTILGPVFQCPEAYKAVQTIVQNTYTQQIFCCPSDYTFNVAVTGTGVPPNFLPSQCTSILSAGQTLTYESTSTGGPWIVATSTIQSTAVSYSTIVYGIFMNGFNILPSTTATSSASAAATTIASTTAQTTSSTSILSSTSAIPSATSVSKTANTSNSISKTAIIGIAVGVIGLIFIALSVAFLLYRRRKQNQRAQDYLSGQPTGYAPVSHELGGSPDIAKSELSGNGVKGELSGDGRSVVYEMQSADGSRVAMHEIPGSTNWKR